VNKFRFTFVGATALNQDEATARLGELLRASFKQCPVLVPEGVVAEPCDEDGELLADPDEAGNCGACGSAVAPDAVTCHHCGEMIEQ